MASLGTDEAAGQGGSKNDGVWISLGEDDALLYEPSIDVITLSDSDESGSVTPSVPKPPPKRIGATVSKPIGATVSKPRIKTPSDAVTRVQPSLDQCDEKIVYTPVQASELERVQRVQTTNQTNGWVEYDESAHAPHPVRLQLCPGLEVEPQIICQMKPLQANGIKFMFDSCYEKVPPPSKNTAGAGCILAHTMGLGKTAQVVVLCHTLLTASANTDTKHVLILVPVSVLDNWNFEFYKWLRVTVVDPNCPENHYTCASSQKSYTVYTLDHKGADVWIETGGVMIASYQRFTQLVRKDARVLSLPDLVVCDEGHYLKNDKGATYQTVNSVTTRRRILLTGTPIQNQLIEYYTLMQLIKPGLLGSRQEFRKHYGTPIQNGLYSNSTPIEIEMMQNRSLLLYRLLGGCVMRRETNVDLEVEKHEFVLFVPMTPIQIKLGQESLKLAKDLNPHANHLFAAFQMLIRVWAHPRAIDFSRYSTPLDPEQDLDSPDASGKMAVVLTLLETLVATEKVVIFSQSLNALGAIEFFIKRRPEFESTYVRYDGSMSTTARTYVLGRFNTDPSTRILLMSIKAGSTGISIVGASRAILFDLPWNPTTDAQSVGRIYRPGQEKTCYVYRLVTSDAMETLMYQQHVVKHGLSSRIIDDRERARLFPESEGLLQTNVADAQTNDDEQLRYRAPPTSDPDFALDALFAKSLVSYYYRHDDLLNTPTPPIDVLNCVERDQIWNSFTGDTPRPGSPEPKADEALPKPKPKRKPKSTTPATSVVHHTNAATYRKPKSRRPRSHRFIKRTASSHSQTNLAKKTPLMKQALLATNAQGWLTVRNDKINNALAKTAAARNKQANRFGTANQTAPLNQVLAANRFGTANQTTPLNQVLAANRTLGRLGTANQTTPLAANLGLGTANQTTPLNHVSAANCTLGTANKSPLAAQAQTPEQMALDRLLGLGAANKSIKQLMANKSPARTDEMNKLLAANRLLATNSALKRPLEEDSVHSSSAKRASSFLPRLNGRGSGGSCSSSPEPTPAEVIALSDSDSDSNSSIY